MISKEFLITLAFVLTGNVLYFSSTTSRTPESMSPIITDTISVAQGQKIFNDDCSGCHTFREDGIGPQLGGLTTQVSTDWLRNFIRNPRKMIESGDQRAQDLFERYNTIMPSFAHYSDDEVDAIIAFLSTQKAPVKSGVPEREGLKNPIAEPIKSSGLVVKLELVTQIPPSRNQIPRTRIAKLDFEPNSKSLFIADHQGKLYKIGKDKPLVYLDMEALKPLFINKPGRATGFGSFAFHPEFQKNGLLYTTHAEAPGSGEADFGYADSIKVTLQWVLSEWKTKTPGAVPFKGKSRELLRIDMVSGIHGVQEITFNPIAKPDDEEYGLLYIGVGDGGSVEQGYRFLAHSKEKIWGSILRIDPKGKNSANKRYGIPPSNPFHKIPGAVKEIYAYGFRNPHRITWSRAGQMLASNIGQHNIEALNMILPGHDYGWPIREGTFMMDPYGKMGRIYPLPPDDTAYHITYPAAQYDHDEGQAISGGFEYWGTEVPQLGGKYIFGDITNGRLFYVDMAGLKPGGLSTVKEWHVTYQGRRVTTRELCGEDWVHLRLGRDHRGELYIFTKPDGKVYKLKSATSL